MSNLRIIVRDFIEMIHKKVYYTFINKLQKYIILHSNIFLEALLQFAFIRLRIKKM